MHKKLLRKVKEKEQFANRKVGAIKIKRFMVSSRCKLKKKVGQTGHFSSYICTTESDTYRT